VREGIIFLSEDFTILSINEAARQLFNIKTDTGGKSLNDHPELWNLFEEPLTHIDKKGRQEIYLKIKKREIKKHQVFIIPEMAQNGKLQNILIVIW
jgi:sensor histidine kinase regulating citrate/malate metabolism